jgi:hypothetical protein
MAGFVFREELRGTHHLVSDPGRELPVEVDLRARVPSLRRFLLDPVAPLEGTLQLAELAERQAFTGRLIFRPMARRLTYELDFESDDGRFLRFRGTRDLEARHPVRSLTDMPATVFADEREVSRVLLRFRPRSDLLRLLRTLRPHA